MTFLSGDLIEYQEHRLYILNTVQHWFKQYIVCIDFTNTLITNNGHITIAILYQTSNNTFSHVEDNNLFDTLHKKNVTKLQKNTKTTLNLLSDANGHRSLLTDNERLLISKYLQLIMNN